MKNSVKRSNLANNIRDYRKKLNMTQEEISEILGIKRNTYARYETDTTPPMPVIIRLCEIFGISTDDLIVAGSDYMFRMQKPPSPAYVFSNYNAYENHENEELVLTAEEADIIVRLRSLPPEQREEFIKALFH